MLADNCYPYSNQPVKYKSKNAPLIVDVFKKFLNIKDHNQYHDNEVSLFYHRLLFLSKYFGLGDNVSVETVYEEFTPEYIFTVHIPRSLSIDEENDIFLKLNRQMEYFCKQNNMFNFLKDAYIIFE